VVTRDPEALRFLVELYEEVKVDLGKTPGAADSGSQIHRRACSGLFRIQSGHGSRLSIQDYKTVIGIGRCARASRVWRSSIDFASEGGAQIAPLPEFLKGPHVTLFGPPDSAKRRSTHECLLASSQRAGIVAELLGSVSPCGARMTKIETPLRERPGRRRRQTSRGCFTRIFRSKRATSLTR